MFMELDWAKNHVLSLEVKLKINAMTDTLKGEYKFCFRHITLLVYAKHAKDFGDVYFLWKFMKFMKIHNHSSYLK